MHVHPRSSALRVPDWPAPEGVHACLSTRQGGVSTAPCDSLNLAMHVGDDGQAVAANRARLHDWLGVPCVYLEQVHGDKVVELPGVTPEPPRADACVTTTPGLACTILVADCLPVLFASRHGGAVAAAHAGWRGLAAGVLERTTEALCRIARCRPDDLIAWLGPAIGPGRFEVGEEVVTAFGTGPRLVSTRPGKWLADLPGLARDRLASAGVVQVFGNDGSTAWCTVSSPACWFSHRRDRHTGRFAACIWLHGGMA